METEGRHSKYFFLVKCLNRTMQYGNFFSSKKYANTAPFKSYYVVWKQELENLEVNICDEFKSYYVVWKQKSNNHSDRPLWSLNRTMQYGNHLGRIVPIAVGVV